MLKTVSSIRCEQINSTVQIIDWVIMSSIFIISKFKNTSVAPCMNLMCHIFNFFELDAGIFRVVPYLYLLKISTAWVAYIFKYKGQYYLD